jgi:serine/threonine protein kinase
MDLTVQNVYGLLIRSKLLPLDEARAMFARWNEEAGAAQGDVAQFARWMVAKQYLTEYQAALLARGHADGFFLGQYKILDRLGKGRMAGVYRAQHELGQVVAIKVLPPSKAKDAALLGRFQREARMAIRLKHPNIVRTFQMGQAELAPGAGKLHFLVMEYLEGETAEDLVQRRRMLPPHEAVRIVYQALCGLQHIHEQGLVHRDLKPSNLMLVYGTETRPTDALKATVKILDIGLGRVLFDESVSAETETDPTLTTEGVLLGTPDYMAPEQARAARTVDIRSDIYSLGCVLYHLLAGQPPFPDTNIISQMIRHATEPLRPLKEFNPAVPDGLQQILNWMLAKDPAQRYPTPERAAQALQMYLLAGTEPPPAPAEPDPRMRSYLTWLEVNTDDQGAARPAPKAGAPVAKPPSGTPPSTAVVEAVRPVAPKPATREMPAAAAPGKRRNRKEKRKGATPPPQPAPMSGEFDVELVPAPAQRVGDAQPSFSLPLTRRDLVMFGIGAGTVTAGIGLGWVFWMLLRPRPKPPPEPTEPGGG